MERETEAAATVGRFDGRGGQASAERGRRTSRTITPVADVIGRNFMVAGSCVHPGVHPMRKPRDLRGFRRYRYRDSNPGFRRERALSSPAASGNVLHLHGKLVRSPIDTAARTTGTPDVGCEWAERSDPDGVSALVTTTSYEELVGPAGGVVRRLRTPSRATPRTSDRRAWPPAPAAGRRTRRGLGRGRRGTHTFDRDNTTAPGSHQPRHIDRALLPRTGDLRESCAVDHAGSGPAHDSLVAMRTRPVAQT